MTDNLPAAPTALTDFLNDPDKLKNLDADKLEKLLAMQLKFQAEQARLDFHGAFCRPQARDEARPQAGQEPPFGKSLCPR